MASLSGVRVLDLGRLIAAPWCTQILADLGAEVIKVERVGRGDELRYYGPSFLKDASGAETQESGSYLTVNRNKKSITVDFSTPRGADLIRELARKSDVFVENYKVGDLERYGLGYEAIRELNPRLVYCSVTGFGQTGPYATRPGLDSLFQGMSGMMSVTGEPDGPPQRVGVWIIDLMTGTFASTAILAALREREVNGGGGQHIDLALMDVAVAAMSGRSIEYFLDGVVPRRMGEAAAGAVPAQVFRCADGLLNIQAALEPHYRALCDVLELPELKSDARFCGRMDRVRNAAVLIPMLAQKIAGWKRADLYEALVSAGVIAGPVYDLDEVPDDPQVRHRGLFFDAPHRVGVPAPLVASPIRMSATPVETYVAPPTMGQHTDAVLADLLGLSGAEIADLRANAVI